MEAEIPLLARFPHLEDLTLSETTITDAAVDTLSTLTSLKRLTMTQMPISDAAMERVTAALPQCKIRTL